MKYSILTTSDESYFPHLKILVNSILDKCDLSYIKTLNIIDNGLTFYQIKYLKDKSNIINIITTGVRTNFSGGTWGEDWQKNVKGKTVHLYDMVSKIQEPLLMLDADMMIMKDLYPLLEQGGDLQVCVRPNNPISKYIGSYFFSINPKKILPFIKEWKEATQNTTGKGAHESPALSRTVERYKQVLDIVEIDQSIVNWFLPPNHQQHPMPDRTMIIHFKGNALFDSFEDQFNARVKNADWGKYVNKYID
jgi:hypothetical protein